MKIELRDIDYDSSNGILPVTANLYIDAELAARVHMQSGNPAHGTYNSSDYHPVSQKGIQLIQAAEAHCLSLPPIVFPPRFGKDQVTWPSTLENRLQELLIHYLDEKDAIKFKEIIDREQIQGIVIGTRDGNYETFRVKVPVEEAIQTFRGVMGIQRCLSYLRRLMKEQGITGQLVLNTNIPESIIKQAGFNEDQYVKPDIEFDRFELLERQAQKQNPATKLKPKKNKGRKL